MERTAPLMSWRPLLEAAPQIQVHAFAALGALVLTPAQLLMPKGTALHRATGWLWMAAMAITAASSFLVHSIRMIGPFSPIHLLSILTLASLPLAIRAARQGDVARHRRIILWLCGGALLGAGLFTLWPGRIMRPTRQVQPACRRSNKVKHWNI